MRAAIYGVDVVRKRKNGLGIAVGILEYDLDAGALQLSFHVERIMEALPVAVKEVDKGLEASFKVIRNLPSLA